MAFLTSQISVILPFICCNAFLMVSCTLPAFFIMNSQISQFYSTTLFIMQFLCNFVLQLIETAVCFTICMIQCVFSILIYSFNHIWDVLAPIYMLVPSEDKWKSIADEFYERWNFPNCIEAIDGKHVMIQCTQICWSGISWPTRNVKWKPSSF